jgi:diguanylate cyclase (GGDEF)-like protein
VSTLPDASSSIDIDSHDCAGSTAIDGLTVASAAGEPLMIDPLAQSVLESIDARVCIVDRHGNIVAANRAWTQVHLPDHESEIRMDVGDNLFRVLAASAGPRVAYARRMIEGVRAVLDGRLDELDYEDADRIGVIRWYRQRVASLAGGGAIVMHHDITDRVRAELHVVEQATRDPLTGLSNRVSLLDRLNTFVAQRRRDVGIAWLDLDRFSAVNDALGPSLADRLLVQVGERLTAQLVTPEYLARLSGDSFVVVAISMRSDAQLTRVARRMQDALTAPFLVVGDDGSERVVALTASVGVTMITREHSSGDHALRDAEAALVQAKLTGRGGIGFVDTELRAVQQSRMELEQDLRRALELDQLTVRFQPEWSLFEQRIVGAEALVRWHHPTLGELSPSQFIPIAEESGDVVDLGSWVLDRAVQVASTWPSINGVAPFVAVNLSAVQLADPALPGRVRSSIERWGLDPRRLMLEITESAVVDRLDLAVGMLDALRGVGVRIALDDFGTGYSSLGILRTLPVDVLKLDKSFIDPLESEPVTREIVRAVLSLAKSLSMDVVAEGVESLEQQRVLHELGCDVIQGYIIAPPQGASDLMTRLTASS